MSSQDRIASVVIPTVVTFVIVFFSFGVIWKLWPGSLAKVKPVVHEIMRTEDGFTDKHIIVGKFSYQASVESSVENDTERLPEDCYDVLLLAFNYPLDETLSPSLLEQLQQLETKSGVVKVLKTSPRTLVIHKQCVPRERLGATPLWTWNGVWQDLNPVVNHYFHNLPQPQ